jgi:hypothetical protein
MTYALAFEPLVPAWLLWPIAAIAVSLLGFALWRRARGTVWRIIAMGALILAALNPIAVQSERERLRDVALVVRDNSESQSLDGRTGRTDTAVEALNQRLAAMEALDVRVVETGRATAGGTELAKAIREGLRDTPPERVAAIFLVSDGIAHDMPADPASLAALAAGAPVHLLLSGRKDEQARRLVVVEGPRFGLVGKAVELAIRVEDQGAADAGAGRTARVTVRLDGTEAGAAIAEVGATTRIVVGLAHPGENVFEIEVEDGPQELTRLNNRAVVVTNAVRDRLRVLLVSGEPHAGERTWRNLLKADPAVDLVHFTILRPPEKSDSTPIEELSLIGFPTQELFEDKIGEFDLIVFDRYQRLSILPSEYYANIAAYVESGGALLVASGPDYASAFSIYNSPLGGIMPASPTGEVTDTPFRPVVAPVGQRHPVTSGLPGANEGDRPPSWGRWFRVADAIPVAGNVVMQGPEAKPLLVLNRVGQGRVALMLSDQAWLWSRGFEGGGPQSELLRRLAHWLMKEPDLEEERLSALVSQGTLTVSRRTMNDTAGPVSVERPDGTQADVPLTQSAPGQFTASINADAMGLYRVRDGDLTAVAASGPVNAREFEDVIASSEPSRPLREASGGSAVWLSDGQPGLRLVGAGRALGGNGWLGVLDRQNYATLSVRRTPLIDPLLAVFLALGLWVFAWRQEGR